MFINIYQLISVLSINIVNKLVLGNWYICLSHHDALSFTFFCPFSVALSLRFSLFFSRKHMCQILPTVPHPRSFYWRIPWMQKASALWFLILLSHSEGYAHDGSWLNFHELLINLSYEKTRMIQWLGHLIMPAWQDSGSSEEVTKSWIATFISGLIHWCP